MNRRASRIGRCPSLGVDIRNAGIADVAEHIHRDLVVVAHLDQECGRAVQGKRLGKEDAGYAFVDAAEADLGSQRWEPVRQGCRIVGDKFEGHHRLRSHKAVG